jgi:hypothetical protein
MIHVVARVRRVVVGHPVRGNAIGLVGPPRQIL